MSKINAVTGFKNHINRLTGFSEVIDFGNKETISRIVAQSKKTITVNPTMKVDCEFCKEKIGLLTDVFQKQANVKK